MNYKADYQTNKWISDNGMDTKTFSITHPKLLKAQMAANTLLKHHQNLLSQHQTTALKKFTSKMAHKNTRTKLKPNSAIPILNISAQINRKLFALAKLIK